MHRRISLSRIVSLSCFLFFLINTPAHAQAPMVNTDNIQRVSDNVYVILDKRANLVPNIGIIIGEESAMVVDTGMGPANAEKVLAKVKSMTDKPVRYLAITHFHPEHGMGAQSFPEETRIVVPRAQKEELAAKGKDYIGFFSGMSPEIAGLLSDVKLVKPDLAFEKRLDIDLGGQTVQLLHFNTAHTQGDMYVFLPDQKILFGGDIIIDRFFPIMADKDSSATGWIEALRKLKSLKPEIVVPGHGDVSDVSLIDQLAIYLNAMQVQVSRLHKSGNSLEQIQATLIPQFTRSYAHWENPEWIKSAIERFHSEL